MVSKGPLLRLLTAINRRRMKLLMGLAFIAYVASVWGNFVNMRSLQENGEQKVESKIEEAVAPLREKIKDLEKSFTQKYPPVKFLSEKDRKRILDKWIANKSKFVFSAIKNFIKNKCYQISLV
uniref:UDP-glucuronate decarboxylase 1 n=1 Tax=Apteryx owenii TaxID=8824 RepID=A0A8B9P4D1_APTOW